ncbi:MAG: rRNA maturation RNase YbeY [Nitrospirae bacterium GWC2_42_7]|nr:MAG: rRNA maturation RNase YbeY [Nitrospirae bacterium GWC2_42_7]
MRSFNLLYRGIDRATDVLSFSQDISDTTKMKINLPASETAEHPKVPPPWRGGDNGEGENSILGDIVVCVPFAQQQAYDLEVPFYDELLRLMIHGLLHLLGYDHEVNKAQKKKMEKKEKELFDAVKTVA